MFLNRFMDALPIKRKNATPSEDPMASKEFGDLLEAAKKKEAEAAAAAAEEKSAQEEVPPAA